MPRITSEEKTICKFWYALLTVTTIILVLFADLSSPFFPLQPSFPYSFTPLSFASFLPFYYYQLAHSNILSSVFYFPYFFWSFLSFFLSVNCLSQLPLHLSLNNSFTLSLVELVDSTNILSLILSFFIFCLSFFYSSELLFNTFPTFSFSCLFLSSSTTPSISVSFSLPIPFLFHPCFICLLLILSLPPLATLSLSSVQHPLSKLFPSLQVAFSSLRQPFLFWSACRLFVIKETTIHDYLFIFRT